MPRFSDNGKYIKCPDAGQWVPTEVCKLFVKGERRPSSNVLTKVCRRCRRPEGLDDPKPVKRRKRRVRV